MLCAPPGAGDSKLTSEQLALYLRCHGIDPEVHVFAVKAAEVGPAILREAAAAGADALLMGSYGQRLRRGLVLGGVTAHVIAHAEMPVLMMH